MTTPLVLVLISGALLAALIVLFVRERTRGSRYAESLRTRLDYAVDGVVIRSANGLPNINNKFFRELFHYVTHKVLSLVLSVVRRVEEYVHRIAQFNRMKASEVRSGNGNANSPHLKELTEHKQQAKLSDSEKKRRRDEALNGKV